MKLRYKGVNKVGAFAYPGGSFPVVYGEVYDLREDIAKLALANGEWEEVKEEQQKAKVLKSKVATRL